LNQNILKIEIEKVIVEHSIMIDQYTVNNDASINVVGSVKFPVNCNYLTKLPLKFNEVTGHFDCSKLNLTTLEGSPVKVGGDFDCSFNPNLRSLHFVPKVVRGYFMFDSGIADVSMVNSNFDDVFLFQLIDVESRRLHVELWKNFEHLSAIFRFQNYYEVWNDDTSLNLENFKILMEDINDGLE
jgi:hypothetical protein